MFFFYRLDREREFSFVLLFTSLSLSIPWIMSSLSRIIDIIMLFFWTTRNHHHSSHVQQYNIYIQEKTYETNFHSSSSFISCIIGEFEEVCIIKCVYMWEKLKIKHNNHKTNERGHINRRLYTYRCFCFGHRYVFWERDLSLFNFMGRFICIFEYSKKYFSRII